MRRCRENQIPDRKQSYGAPLAGCTVDGNEVVFSVVMLPVPFLLDRFTGHLRGDTLAGTVERTGRELTNRMTGTNFAFGKRREP